MTKRNSGKYFEWISQCCRELNWDIRDGNRLVQDINWFACYDDGMSPEEAVDEAISKGVVKKRKMGKQK